MTGFLHEMANWADERYIFAKSAFKKTGKNGPKSFANFVKRWIFPRFFPWERPIFSFLPFSGHPSLPLVCASSLLS